jgi:hypothetical protein
MRDSSDLLGRFIDFITVVIMFMVTLPLMLLFLVLQSHARAGKERKMF